jgi:chromosome segregation ATPase
MSMFGGRRGTSAAPGSIRVEPAAARTGAGDSHARTPHFRPAPAPGADAETLDEARQILEDLRVHLAELDRREQSLNSQLSLLEREQRALRLQSQKLADDSREIQQVLEEREQRLTDRETAAADLVLATDERQASLDEQLADIERQRAQLKDLVATELIDEHQRLANRLQEVEQARLEIEQQRARLKGELAAEVADEHRQLAARQNELDLVQIGLEQERARLEEDVRAGLAHEQRALDDRSRELDLRQTEFEQKNSVFAAEIARRESLREQEIAEHAALLAQMRAEQLAEVEARESQVSQREVDLVKRARFQEDHLIRLRSGIEAKQAELERDRASLAVWNTEVESTVRQRLSHLRKYRDLLDRRESDCESAWQALADARQQQQAKLETLRQNIIADQQALEAHQQTTTGDLRRHADLLRLREQEVERRGARIDQLRDDLDRRQQLIAAREADLHAAVNWLSDHVGADEVATLLPYLEPAAIPEPVVDDQRREIADAERQLSQWQHELQRDREAFAQMIADREQRLRAREATLGRQYEQLATREATLQSEQLRDRTEREQTFVLLESLVDQIEQRLHNA